MEMENIVQRFPFLRCRKIYRNKNRGQCTLQTLCQHSTYSPLIVVDCFHYISRFMNSRARGAGGYLNCQKNTDTMLFTEPHYVGGPLLKRNYSKVSPLLFISTNLVKIYNNTPHHLPNRAIITNSFKASILYLTNSNFDSFCFTYLSGRKKYHGRCHLLCISTSFRVLRAPESWLKYFFSAIFNLFCLITEQYYHITFQLST